VKIDSEKNDFIVEELDDQTLVIKEGMLHILKMRLNEVPHFFPSPTLNLAFTSLPKEIALLQNYLSRRLSFS
jgi:hypothetical protein